MLASSIYQLSGPRNLRVVLSPQEVDGIQSFFVGICRICTPGEAVAYKQESYDGINIYAWVERKVTLADVSSRGDLICEVRRRIFSESGLPHVVSMPELRFEEAGPQTGSRQDRAYFMQCVLHSPEPEEPDRELFDIGRLIDLPPDGYPLSETPVETLRNILVKRDPGSHNRQWAWQQRMLLLKDAAEERHANRVLDNEWLSNRPAA
ncbi:hypothetical protein K8R04_04435 [Candidatus Uhrbacteria bacterium]|nr:hypothetical protein [Candidatus Uhrbacteria bacterium]